MRANVSNGPMSETRLVPRRLRPLQQFGLLDLCDSTLLASFSSEQFLLDTRMLRTSESKVQEFSRYASIDGTSVAFVTEKAILKRWE